MLGFGPNVIAKGIVRATKYNLAFLPIRPEAWFGYLASRISPGAWRFVVGQATPARVSAVVRFGVRLVPERILRLADRT